MTSYGKQLAKRECWSGKKQYKTETQAWGGVVASHKRGIYVKDVYFCNDCGFYHLTSGRPNYQNMPYWVRKLARRNRKWYHDQKQREKKLKERNNYLPIAEQKKILKNLNNNMTTSYGKQIAKRVRRQILKEKIYNALIDLTLVLLIAGVIGVVVYYIV